MIVGRAAVETLKRERPEWTPWLRLVEETLVTSASNAWNSIVPSVPRATPPAPALSGSVVVVPESLLRGHVERLASRAARGGTAQMTTLGKLVGADLDLAGLLHASLTQDPGLPVAIASSKTVDPEALQALVALVGLPLLHACRARWASAVESTWTEGYCPICGAWPAFAEVRGIERSRFHRCGRCGSEWHAQILQCTYCRTREHTELVALVPEKQQGSGAVDGCTRCKGYLKVSTRLQGCAPAAVMLEDLASVHLDVAALQAGYRRPSGAGCLVPVTVNVSRSVAPPWADS